MRPDGHRNLADTHRRISAGLLVFLVSLVVLVLLLVVVVGSRHSPSAAIRALLKLAGSVTAFQA